MKYINDYVSSSLLRQISSIFLECQSVIISLMSAPRETLSKSTDPKSIPLKKLLNIKIIVSINLN